MSDAMDSLEALRRQVDDPLEGLGDNPDAELMPRQELAFPEWIREARRILNAHGSRALRDNIAEHVDEEQQKAVLARLQREAGVEEREPRTERERLDEIVTAVNALDFIIGMKEDIESGES